MLYIFPVEEFLFCTFVRMPVYCIAYGCDNDQHNASPGSKLLSFAIEEAFAVETGISCQLC